MKNEKINVEYQFNFYLNKVGLGDKKDKLDPKILLELKRAFYAGVTQMIVLMGGDLYEMLNEDIGEGVNAIESIRKQCNDFWSEQSGEK